MVFIHYVIYSLTRLESSPHVNRVGLIYWQVKKVFFIPTAILKIQKMLSYFSTHYSSQASNKNHSNDAHKPLKGWRYFDGLEAPSYRHEFKNSSKNTDF